MQIYADNAATTKLSTVALRAMEPFWTEIYANPSSLHSPAQRAKEALEDARSRIAKIINCSPREIFFTSGGSEADNQAIFSAAAAGEKKGKKHIISTAFEHHAVLHCLDRLEKQGFEITRLPVGENGIVLAEDVKSAIREDTCLVSVMYANNEIGTIQPIAEIGAICRERKIPFHTDAVQAVGHLPIDAQTEQIDLLSASAHKFHGPRGVGFLYARRGFPLQSLIEGGAQERGKRAGTENLPAIVGMAAALEESIREAETTNARISQYRDEIIDSILAQVPHCVLNGDREKRLAGNISFCFEGIEGESLLLLLDSRGIAASSGSACTSGSLEPSHVLLSIGRIHDIAHGSLRLTLDKENNEEEVAYILKVLPEIVSYLRSISPIWHDLITGKKNFITK